MFDRRLMVLILGTCFLQACTAPVAPRSAMVMPVFEIRHSANNAAATYARLGKYHLDRGDLDQARAAYMRTIALDGRQPSARNALAVIDAQQGRLDEAATLLNGVLSDFPTLAYSISNLGYVYYLQGQFDRAVTMLERAVALDAANDRARGNLGLAKAAVASQLELAKIRESIAARSQSATNMLAIPLEAGPAVGPGATTLSPGVSIDAPSLEASAPLANSDLAANGRPFLHATKKSRFDLVQNLPNVFTLTVRPPGAPVAPIVALLAGADNRRPFDRPSTTVRVHVAPAAVIEIANGNGVKGLAGRLRLALDRKGISIARLSNLPPYTQQNTEIYYRTGHLKQASELRAALSNEHVALRVMQSTSGADIKLVLGKATAVQQIADRAIVNTAEDLAINGPIGG